MLINSHKKESIYIFINKWINLIKIIKLWITKKYHYSMYSHDNVYDCGKYAESKGGGGHRGAAGFTSTELLFRKVN